MAVRRNSLISACIFADRLTTTKAAKFAREYDSMNGYR
jgi:hypothetical protein